MSHSFDIMISLAIIVIGIMMLMGKGDIFMGGSNKKERREKYDDHKAQKGFGVSLIVVGIATIISSYVNSTAGWLIYILVVFLAFAGGILYMMKKCKK